MLVLDENLPVTQRQLLRKWQIPFRVVETDTAAFGTSDENFIPILHHLPQPTFFSADAGFFKQSLCHRDYALVHLNVRKAEIATFIRRFLKHPRFDSQSKRFGVVARVQPGGVQFWRKGERGLHHIAHGVGPEQLVATEQSASSFTPSVKLRPNF